jgi:proteasome accessory factor C
MLPWLMERGEVRVADMAAQFHVTEAELVKDLELVAMCGLPPYVDELIDVFIDEGPDGPRVVTGVPRVFTKPLRLTAPEGFALLTAGRAALALPGADPAGPLARALDKLADALGGATVAVDTSLAPHADVMAAAIEQSEILAIRYWSPARDEVTERRIVPRAVFTDRGNWYVVADDERSGEERTFRLDRVVEVAATGEHAPARDVPVPQGNWFEDADTVATAVLLLEPDGAWVTERYPVRRVSGRDDGTIEVELPVTSERWLSRLLLRLGPSATVLAPAEWTDLAARTAAAVRARYTPA